MPEAGVKLCPHEEMLSYEEIEQVATSALAAGIKKFRITGGEPLARKGLTRLLEKLAALGPDDLALTTNGLLLAQAASSLKAAGLKRVTISLDTLKAERFERITRRPGLEQVFAALERSRKAGLLPLKINAVIIRGVNDDEVLDFVRLGEKEGIEVRFIELMPTSGLSLGCKEIGRWDRSLMVSGEEIRKKIEQELGPLTRSKEEDGVAKIYFTRSGAKIGLITPVSEKFCEGCQRLRLGPEGKLRICLFERGEIDLRKELRENKADPERLSRILIEALEQKAGWERGDLQAASSEMFRIGG
jgi:cyclic pyranopterin phosphate synthase